MKSESFRHHSSISGYDIFIILNVLDVHQTKKNQENTLWTVASNEGTL